MSVVFTYQYILYYVIIYILYQWECMTRRWYAPSGPLHTLYLIVMVYIFYCWILSLLFSHASIILSWFSFRVFSIYSIFSIHLSIQLILVFFHVISCHEEQLWTQGESWSMSSVASLHSSSFHYVLRTCVLPHCPQVRSCRYMYGYTLYIGTMLSGTHTMVSLHVRWLKLCLDSPFYISLNYTIYIIMFDCFLSLAHHLLTWQRMIPFYLPFFHYGLLLLIQPISRNVFIDPLTFFYTVVSVCC